MLSTSQYKFLRILNWLWPVLLPSDNHHQLLDLLSRCRSCWNDITLTGTPPHPTVLVWQIYILLLESEGGILTSQDPTIHAFLFVSYAPFSLPRFIMISHNSFLKKTARKKAYFIGCRLTVSYCVNLGYFFDYIFTYLTEFCQVKGRILLFCVSSVPNAVEIKEFKGRENYCKSIRKHFLCKLLWYVQITILPHFFLLL